MALTLAGMVLFVVANSYPFLGFRIGGQICSSNLITGVMELFRQKLWLLSALVLATTVVVPAFQLGGIFYVLLPFFTGRSLPKRMEVFRVVMRIQPWGMTEVFFLGILVALVKLSKMATILPGIALYAFLTLMFVLAAITAFLDPHIVWAHGERAP